MRSETTQRWFVPVPRLFPVSKLLVAVFAGGWLYRGVPGAADGPVTAPHCENGVSW